MNINVVGCGKMGKAIAFYIVTLGIKKLNLLDTNVGAAEKIRDFLHGHFMGISVQINATPREAYFILSIPWKETLTKLEEIFNRTPKARVVSITRPADEDLITLAEMRKRFNFLLACGLEPGLTELIPTTILQDDVSDAHQMKIYCGGLVEDSAPPFNHGLLFGDKISLSQNLSYYLLNNRICVTEKLEGLETLSLPEIGVVEAYHDGMMSDFAEFLKENHIYSASQKTIRYPGHTACMRILRDLELLNDVDVSLPSHPTIQPRKWLTDYLLSKGLISNSTKDKTILSVQYGTNYEDAFTIISRYDSLNQLSGMATLTGFTIAFCALSYFDAPPDKNQYFYPYRFFSTAFVKTLISKLRALDSITYLCKN